MMANAWGLAAASPSNGCFELWADGGAFEKQKTGTVTYTQPQWLPAGFGTWRVRGSFRELMLDDISWFSEVVRVIWTGGSCKGPLFG